MSSVRHVKTVHRGPKRARTEADESDEGSCGRNRHRVTRACNECRRRKDRCGGQKPSCKSCTENDRVCNYGPSKKRGLRPGYVRAIEVLLGLMITTIEGSEAWICGLLQGKSGQTSLRPALLQLHESDMSVDFLLERWRKCALAEEARKLLAPDRVEVDETDADSTQHFDTKVVEALSLSQGSRSGDTDSLLTPMNTDTTPQDMALLDSPNTPIVSTNASEHCKDTEPHTPPHLQSGFPARESTEISLSHITTLPKNWTFLMDVYFETTHSWFPIAQKHELLRTAYTVANSPAPSAITPSSGQLAFLHAVLIYASHQSISIANSLKPPLDHSYGAGVLQSLTHSSLFSDSTNYDLGHVRAFLVLSLLEMDQEHWTAAWVAIGRAVYTATSIGLIARSSTDEYLLYDDDVKRTLLGCVTLETMIASRLGTATCLKSSDISPKTLLMTDGMEEWEPWQPKVLLNVKAVASRQVSNPHAPGHVVSTFNRLLKVIAQLNDLIDKPQSHSSDKDLNEIMAACQQNLLDELPAAADLPPQKLCLWMASVATLEVAAAERLDTHGTNSWRPDGYWKSIASLVNLVEIRVNSMGRCSVSPIVRSFLELLQKALTRHPLQYIGTEVQDDFNLLTRAISASLSTLKPISSKRTQLDAGSKDQTSGFSHSVPLAFETEYVPPRTDTVSDIPTTTLTLGTLLEVMDHSIAQDDNSTSVLQQTPGEEDNMTFGTSRDHLGGDLEDDSLFDSLATLDSTDWLANPPEFMQHLGLLDNPPKSMENIFDMEY
ncbi:quinic acid utilization activator [Fusarium longipes]|uniref:Quinic acid utilization activator n=1 Tax=Fusarium longipes TaxID=694270 RepID=A0A395T7I3_9HYPO|nr:quinic acid utilization activator [Fusarium longipes]